MAGSMGDNEVFQQLDADWPPMRHVQRGWERLNDGGRSRVLDRIKATLSRFEPPENVNHAALRRFFSFLAQAEIIAIDIPLMALPTAEDDTIPLLERQLADEVFHAALFGRLATRMGGLEEPIPQAEVLLDSIRAPEDRRTRAVLLNLIAEGWFETLLEHASRWGIADDVFRIVLADEGRHVDEGHIHAEGVDPQEIEPAVRSFETELFHLVQDPHVMLPTLALAGEENFQALSEAYLQTHEQALGEVGLEPTEGFQQMTETLQELRAHGPSLSEAFSPQRVEPETQWRRTALHLWDTPRDPVMHGWFDVETGHIPDRLLTPILVAAVGRVWHEYPRINRYTVGGELYEPSGVNVGVRVSLGEQQEALSTIVVPDAHTRSIADIQRILETGVSEMVQLGDELDGLDVDEQRHPLREVLCDEELMGMVPPEMMATPVTVSNVGPAGLVAGVGAMPGALGQSVEFILGRVQQRPVWNGEQYIPGDVATIGASADHRVVDGNHAGQAMRRVQDALSEQGAARIMTREDTIPPDADLGDVSLGGVGVGHQQAQVLMSCKSPLWFGWLCWMFKK